MNGPYRKQDERHRVVKPHASAKGLEICWYFESVPRLQEEESEEMDEEDGLKDDFDDIEIDAIDDGDLEDYEESDDDAEDI